ncbi:MAG TPA: hypothetical protein VK963_04220 [Candidatus Saccharimonadales bacterium]|nr:hypothetical protein [Candidatus Saccharimonadales bacterium]
MSTTRTILSNIAIVAAMSVFPMDSAYASASSAPEMTDGAPTCTVTAAGGDDLTGEHPEGRISSHDNVVTGYVDVTGPSNCKVNATLTTWTAPNGFDGKPYDLQRLFDTKTLQFSVGTHNITTHIPDCYFQADLVRGTEPAGYDGGPIYEEGRMMASLHGGTQPCEENSEGGGTGETPEQPQPPVTENPTLPVVNPPEGGKGGGNSQPSQSVQPPQPVQSVQPAAQPNTNPATLPETGAAHNLALLVSSAFAVASAAVTSRLQRRSI